MMLRFVHKPKIQLPTHSTSTNFSKKKKKPEKKIKKGRKKLICTLKIESSARKMVSCNLSTKFNNKF